MSPPAKLHRKPIRTRVLGVGEDDRGVQRGDRAGHDLGRDTLEGGDELAQDRPDAEQDHGHGHAELEALGHRRHQVVADA